MANDRNALQEFDIKSRGCVDLVEEWRKDHDAVRATWRIEDLVTSYLACYDAFDVAFEHYCENGKFPSPSFRFSFYIAAAKRLLEGADILESFIRDSEDKSHPVDGSVEFRARTGRVKAIVDEDNFATDAALAGLGNWD